MPDRNNLRKKRFIWAHGCRGFSLWLLGPMRFSRTSWEQKHVAEKVFTSLWTRKQGEGNRRRGRVGYSSKDIPPVIYFLQLGPTSYHLPPPNNATIL
jgi:hypothetical protein